MATDYTKLRKNGEPPEASGRLPDSKDRRWWSLKGKDCCDSIYATINMLQNAQTPRMRQQVISMRLYGNYGLFGVAGAAYAKALAQQTAVKDRVTYNAIQSIIDTVTSKVGETKPRPYFLTSGGNYRQQRKAKKLNQLEEGNFYENKTYDKGLLAFRDGAIQGDGFIYVFARGGKVRHERVMGSEIWVDEEEAQYGFPRNLHRVKVVDREALCELFPEKRDAIWRAPRAPDVTRSSVANLSDMVTVTQSWHLGTMNDAGKIVGGKQCIALVAEGVMLEEPSDWEHDFFPFAKIPWCERPNGYWSQGLAEQLQGDQLELNKELWLIQRSMHMAGSVKVLLKNGSKVVKETVNNEIGAIVNWAGETPPTFFCPEPIHPVYFENTNRIIERMYAKSGTSELSAAGKKPMGLDSGAAQREFEDIQSDRFRTIQRQNDNFYLAISALDIATMREMKSLKSVRVPGKGSFTEIDFKRDIGSLDDSEFVMQCFPVSRLPKEPSGRLATVQEYVAAGFISPRHAKRLLDFPDIDSIESLGNAQEDVLTKIFDAIVDDGEYQPPEPTDDLTLAKEMAVEYIQKYRALDLEPEKLTLLRNFNSQVDMLVKRAMPKPALSLVPGGAGAPGGGGVGAPQAAPEPTPTSDLIPNTAAAAA